MTRIIFGKLKRIAESVNKKERKAEARKLYDAILSDIETFCGEIGLSEKATSRIGKIAMEDYGFRQRGKK